MSRMTRPVVFVLLGILIASVNSGCAWRTGRSEHYFGPVLFRYSQADGGGPSVLQVRQAGLWGEVGTQWGLSVGFSERTVAAAMDGSADGPPAPVTPSRWDKPLSALSPPAAGRWNLSLLYLRGDEIPEPLVVRRTMYGAALLMGKEVKALSVGVTARTQVEPPQDAFSLLRFDADHPLEMRFVIWRLKPGEKLTDFENAKEEEP